MPPGFIFVNGESALILEAQQDALLLYVTGQHRDEDAARLPALRLNSAPPLLSRKVSPSPSSSMGAHN